ncbi:hypothetical protein IE53DRAFT_386472 [Violaceomyces palustris]|uniref:Uncharacterized protein n=1 Tax=Violaceomyces palustris TaxID=1673888 RepID=A0ACD0NZH3_9BASI|nr:hypothetical protein IE53DRAFT_386472 [Violaceomyces palustris]
MARRSWLQVYLALVLLRSWLALTGTAYIHPDEWFQSGEVIAGDLFGIQTTRTWEFTVSKPCRSMASLRLSTLPLALLSYLLAQWRQAVKAEHLFLVQRSTGFLLSLILDLSCALLAPRSKRALTLLLLASSSSVLTFHVRPFSNSIESCMLALALVVIQRLCELTSVLRPKKTVEKKSPTRSDSIAWILNSLAFGAILSIGLFSRFTFAIFAASSGLVFLALAWSRAEGHVGKWVSTISVAIVSFLATSAAHITFDSTYYSSDAGVQEAAVGAKWYDKLHVTPWNAFSYNLGSENLAQHGIHPRWLHALVNYPMIVGLAPFATLVLAQVKSWRSKKPSLSKLGDVGGSGKVMSSVYKGTIVMSLLGLSISPHQEPRFLLPLVLPSILLICHTSERGLVSPPLRNAFITCHLLQSLLQTLFFGYLHQGGLVPAMLWTSEHRGSSGVDMHKFIFWRTFKPPAHLIPTLSTAGDRVGVPNHIIDLGSSTAEKVESYLEGLGGRVGEDVYLFAPRWAMLSRGEERKREEEEAAEGDERVAVFGKSRLRLIYSTRIPNLDMDHIPEMMGAVRKVGFGRGLDLGVYKVGYQET